MKLICSLMPPKAGAGNPIRKGGRANGTKRTSYLRVACSGRSADTLMTMTSMKFWLWYTCILNYALENPTHGTRPTAAKSRIVQTSVQHLFNMETQLSDLTHCGR
jgi:hypothetical protein